MAEEGDTSVLKVRGDQRELLKVIREQNKVDILNQNREHISEVKKSFSYISVDEMRELSLNLVKSKDQLSILQQIKNGSTFGESHIESFLRVPGAVEKLVGRLCGTDAEQQLEAAACITNLTAGSHKSTQKIAKAAGAYLVTYMHSDSHFLQSQCAWAAGNIANDCEKCFAILNAQGLLPALGSLLRSQYPEVVQSAVFALKACSKYNNSETQEMLRKNLMQFFIQTLHRNDVSHHALVDTMFVLSNVSLRTVEFSSEEEQKILADAVLNHLGKATMSDNINILLATPAVRCLGSLSTGSTSLCDFILNYGVFRICVMKIMDSNFYYLKREMLWVLSNLLNSPESSANWCWVMDHIKPFLSPLEDSAIQALYFLCILKSTKTDFECIFMKTGLAANLEILYNCGKAEIELAAKTFSSIPPFAV